MRGFTSSNLHLVLMALPGPIPEYHVVELIVGMKSRNAVRFGAFTEFVVMWGKFLSG
jgi:hypothetical protein